MKKLFLFVAAVAMASCSGDDSPGAAAAGSSFNFDGTQFNMQAGMGISEFRMTDISIVDGVNLNRSTISVSGINGTMDRTATISFDLYHKAGTSVAGTYQISDEEDDIDSNDFETYILSNDRACLGWTTSGMAASLSGGSMVNGNNPTGTVTITANSATNYTVTFSGDFRKYDFDGNITQTIPASVNVAGEVTIND